MNNVITIALIFLLAAPITADNFDKVKNDLKQDGCFKFEFLNTIESEYFDVIDSIYGLAYIASDGKYHIKIGEEIYIGGVEKYYSYIPENNQVIIENRDSSQFDEISFIINLDKFYNSTTIEKNLKYSLVRKSGIAGDFPDSLIVTIDSKKNRMKEIEYLDINDELNRIIFLNQEFFETCDDSQFVPVFPDSVEKVKL